MGKKLKRKRKGHFHKGGAFRLWMIRKGAWKKFVERCRDGYNHRDTDTEKKTRGWITSPISSAFTWECDEQLYYEKLSGEWYKYCKRKGIR